MGDPRPAERLATHYAIERELAERLKAAPSQERSKLYSTVYDELFARVSDHPQLTKQVTTAERARQVSAQLSLLAKYLHPDATFLEIGAGDAALSLAVAPRVQWAVAVDVSRLIPQSVKWPDNFRLHISNGTDLGVAGGTVWLAYSNQLLEHLHPDDALAHLRNVAAALVAGGAYVCRTPNRLTGPHDISRGFDAIASGLHLREYSRTELGKIFLAAGFSKFECYTLQWGRLYPVPMWIVRFTEAFVELMPWRVHQYIADRSPFRKVLSVLVVAIR